MQNMTEYFGEPISIYARAQAIEDGVLIDVSVSAREAGFKFPVAVTRTVWDGYVVPDSRARYYQDEMGRLWDILNVLRWYARRSRERGGSEIHFPVTMIMKARQRRKIVFKALCGPGDNAEPVITIMMPDED
ncbi:MAG: hypothetical protein IH861_11145 [Chloroflexi bacterium]|nr:hypothetical protein [Chloroflexota bacterium]